MKALETYLLPEFLKTSASGRVHSVFTHAVNIVFSDTMVTLHADPDAGIPDSVVLNPESFKRLCRLEAGEMVICENASFFFAEIAQTIDLSVLTNSNTFSDSSGLASGPEIKSRLRLLENGHRLPARTEILLPELFHSIIDNDPHTCERLLPEFIGLGGGLTPSSDDALLGIMAVTALYAAIGINLMPDFPALAYRSSAGRTTDVSRKYLRCATQGRFARPLLRCVNSLLTKHAKADPAALDLLLNTGHTSGRDMLRGILLAVSCWGAEI